MTLAGERTAPSRTEPWTTPAPARSRSSLPGLAGVCLAVALAWLPFLARSASPDEGGFLLVASQWAPGTSLYGDYWVDRPPLLIAVFGLADQLGGTIALRLLGIGFVVGSVLLAGLLGHLTAPDTSRRDVLAPAVVAAVFLATPLFGTMEVNGELLAVPFVLAGVGALLLSLRSRSRPGALGLACAAGALGAAAALVKQNVVDVVVFAVVLGVQLLLAHRPGTLRRSVAGVAGASASVLVVLGAAAARGTSPAGLWDAVVTFRLDAAAVINASSSPATAHRLGQVVLAFAVSGAPLVLVAAGRALGRRAATSEREPSGVVDLRWPALAVLGWEVTVVALGGSYWLHYLIGTVPGLVLVVVAARQRRGRGRALPLATAYAALVAVVGVVWFGSHLPTDTDREVVRYLRAHADPGDTVVVGFGHPDIVQRAGLTSPYPELWSLPVRVRDSDLNQLDSALTSSRRPTWVVVSGGSLATWGVDATTAQPILDRRYTEVVAFGDEHLFRARGDRTATGAGHGLRLEPEGRRQVRSVSPVAERRGAQHLGQVAGQ